MGNGTTIHAGKRAIYPAYKPSGMNWVGDVPEHWNVRRLKYTASINDEALPETTDPDYEFTYVDIGSVDASKGIVATETYRFEDAPSRARRIVREGDTIVSTVRTYLRAITAIREPAENLIVSTGFAVVRPRSLDPGYLSYALRSPFFVETVVSRSTGVSYPAINAPEVGNIGVTLPPLAEQKAIAAFLDRETARIDALIEKKRRQIELLQEKRSALISHAVTKGLDPNAPMKDSGIEWLGDVPEHCDVDRAKWTVTDCRNGIWGEESDGINDLPCVRVADFDRTSFRVRIDDPTMRAVTPKERRGRLLQNGDLLLEKSGGGDLQPVGAVMQYDHDVEAVCANFIARMPVANGYASRFLAYLHAHLTAGRVNTRSIKQTTGIQNIDSQQYLNEVVVHPPHDEQKAIAAFLDRETARIDALIETVQGSIERLHEFRVALISAAVTGKIDVRGEVSW